MGKGILKVIAGLLVFVVTIECSALLATAYTSRRMAAMLQQSTMSASCESSCSHIEIPEGMKELDFYEATGIRPDELRTWFENLQSKQQMDKIRLVLTLNDERGRCLVDNSAAIQWTHGIEWRQIGSSGLAEFSLTAAQLSDLALVVPRECHSIRQRTFRMGTQFEEPPQLSVVKAEHEIVDDDALQQKLYRSLLEVRSPETVFRRLNAEEALRRAATAIEITPPQTQPRSSSEIYDLVRRSIVVIGMLHPDGVISQGTGFVVNSDGVIATNFHVVNKPDAVAAGVLSSDHQFFELTEFLAGNPADDLALIRVNSDALTAIPLAATDAKVGTELTAITHPDSNYFSMTSGRATRYYQTMRHGQPSLRLGVTADFSEGSSGGPLLDECGNVLGIVSAIRGSTSQMVHREAIPVSSLKVLLNF